MKERERETDNFSALYIDEMLVPQAVWVFSLIDYTPPTYNNGSYRYPVWAETLGWIIASLSLICIPAQAVAVILQTEGNSLLDVS
jgi:solute carrier family 6 GABA transporter-like protein 6/8/11/12/13